ncbi:predicted protein [Sclerotinia sclerotiorum 1980 UF-70]|uniref:Uncharacterized protein n=1 Tax=Sclerotinia sclerotiorum (strain ATCC 18683 / 1980 / Ss-1) TaxID=665079 RepID=A7EMU8_SCLS1|nr:predicted protein [Sclerotinia sclerotiorum 1980 UF-70]EDO04164.1 predicted protein [Sclerotinia sclerotiorum 1980 UF-70]
MNGAQVSPIHVNSIIVDFNDSKDKDSGTSKDGTHITCLDSPVKLLQLIAFS